uniref:VTT domain-containing protein n=1 Tax=Leptocylindrus danicus TaxID=163516 RepID=A0A7S2PDT1_9STRA
MSTAANQDDQLPTAGKKGGTAISKLIIGTILIGFIAYVIYDSASGEGRVTDTVDDFLQWVEDNPTEGVFAFIGVYFVATVLFIPGTILTLGAGFVFSSAFGLGPGVLLASAAVFVGASTGAIASFLLGRYLLQDWVTTLTQKYTVFEAIDGALTHNGFKIMSLLRLSPIIPFNALNYIAGVTSISFRDNTLALFFILPGTILYVFLGSSAGSLSDSESSGSDQTTTIITVVFGVIFGFLAIAATSYYAKKELRAVIARQEAEAMADGVPVDRDGASVEVNRGETA